MGVTLVLPSTAKVAVTPEMDTEVASVVVHVRVTAVPDVIEVADAVNVSITGSGGLTVMVMDRVAAVVPLAPLAVSV